MFVGRLAYKGVHGYVGHAHRAVVCHANVFLTKQHSSGSGRSRRKTHRTNIAMHDILRVNVGESTCGLIYYVQAIGVGIETNIMENIPVAIIWCRNGGHDMPCHSHGGRPSGGYVLVIMADHRPTFLEQVDYL